MPLGQIRGNISLPGILKGNEESSRHIYSLNIENWRQFIDLS